MDMDLREFVKIAETTNREELNSYLELGWTLLGIASITGEYGGFAYSLGWSKSKGEVKELPPRMNRL